MNPFTAWFDALRFAADSQHVIALRMVKFAAHDAKAQTEATRMVSEKIAAVMESQLAMMQSAALGHQPHIAAQRALAPYRRRVRANVARLTRG